MIAPMKISAIAIGMAAAVQVRRARNPRFE
jgi:hypothetical protein